MSLFAQLMDELEEKIAAEPRKRGERLFEEGDAEVTDARDGVVRGRVFDGRNYKVNLTWGPEGYSHQCNCADAAGNKDVVCAHMWAVGLTVQEEGWLEDAEEDEWIDLDETDWRGASPAEVRRMIETMTRGGRQTKGKPAQKAEAWKIQLDAIARLAESEPGAQPWPADKQLVYIVDRQETMVGRGIVLETAARAPKKDGTLSAPKAATLGREQIATLPDAQDRLIAATLLGAGRESDYYYSYGQKSKYTLTAELARAVLPAMCRTGRCLYRAVPFSNEGLTALRWEEAGGEWRFRLHVSREGDAYRVQGQLVRGEEVMPLAAPSMLTAGGLLFFADRIEPFDDGGAFEWIQVLRGQQEVRVPVKSGEELTKRLYGLRRLPPVNWPEELRVEEVQVPVRPKVRIRAPKKRGYYGYGDDRLLGELRFVYEDQEVEAQRGGAGVLQMDKRRLIKRDAAAEAQATARLYQLGFRSAFSYETERNELMLAKSKLPKVVATLVREGWQVEADGKLYRQPGEFKIEVTSGIDWFELHGSVQFGDQAAALPALLAALKRGETVVQLGDGTFGMLPEAWLKKYGLLASAGTVEGDHLNFKPAQVGLLDALLASQPAATCDATFEAMRENLRRFQGIEPVEAPEGFVGELRPYQKDGLGWMHFLRRFRFGGCLADDMGLGKTIQVLATVQGRKVERQQAESTGGQAARGTQDSGGTQDAARQEPRPPASANGGHRPALVVVPRSLVFNWKQEAAKFAPALRVLDQSGVARMKGTEHLSDYDLVLTTYGTLRKDVVHLKDYVFDYVVLDEAQAIKNPSSESAKAVRLLRGENRLALSGTPIQNHLGDLWSLFEFLNPGMLGSTAVFAAAGAVLRNPDEETRKLLGAALRPFILRRTKEQVAKDLPLRQEQTILCELEPKQRKSYDELKEHYRQALLGTIAREGINKAKIQILEALLRLRQAACHPGLIDKKRIDDPSAKLDMLVSRMEEVIDEGHKVLVFSQFTSFLAIVRKALEVRKITYEYLDGQTHDRQARVERFQGDEACRTFLISLKAGGLGLNLTAADYVFLLDPWWNPAIEAQAIDRAHRIGQDKHVIACRLIAKDTVEEKVLQLQEQKRSLADALINSDNSLIRDLGKEDLELLLS